MDDFTSRKALYLWNVYAMSMEYDGFHFEHDQPIGVIGSKFMGFMGMDVKLGGLMRFADLPRTHTFSMRGCVKHY